ncbi:hypothetical protein [Streptomyces sp. NPDC090022]|uniref:hypothetical protein n=1 Tax=Streptomyces sp. NPDC090022 TaxID=3365920 RepID=UPI003825A746
MIDRIRGSFPGHEVNLVLGEGDGWTWAVHEMVTAETDFAPVDCHRLGPEGVEPVVLVTEPCSAKARPPEFRYVRAAHTVLRFGVDDLQQRVGQDPEHLSPALLAAGLIGPDAYGEAADEDDGHTCYDHRADDRARLLRVITDFFGLPALPPSFPPEATAR